jgi:hypothetical protein
MEHMWARRCAHRVLVGKHEEVRLFGRPRRRWHDKSKTDLKDRKEA